ncbi:MAG: DUF885 family protein [Novosphingobium sp.]|nr:DUF885 family protein [Novosphingobium sp.]
MGAFLTADRRTVLAGLGATALAACARTAAMPTQSVDAAALLDRIANDLLALQPETATWLGLDTGDRAPLRARLTDRSRAGQDRIAAFLRESLAAIDSMDRTAVPPERALDLDVARTAFRNALDGFAQPYGDVAVGGYRNSPYVVIQNVGAYIDIPRLLDADQPVRNADDAEAWLARLESMAPQLDGETARVRGDAETALVPPDFLLVQTLAQLGNALAETRADNGPLVAALARRTAGIPGNWTDHAQAILRKRVAPALERQAAALRALQPRARPEPGMSARPHGDEYYRWALRAGTTTNLSPEEVHALGLEELQALHARMEPLLAALGYTKGSVGARMKALGDDPRYAFSPGDQGRAEIMTAIQGQLVWIKARMPRAFRTLASGNVEVRRLPLSEEPGAPAAYGGAGSIDGSIPGKFWINLRTPALHNRFSLPTLTHHEAIPGHAWQGEYANRLPLIRALLSFNAYSEGWALYAQQLADELGAYEGDPAGKLGYLQSLAFRACRMVVDTGLHAKGWSREQAVAFFVDVNGSNPQDVRSEVDRYCSWPGQACGYKIGHSEIVRQRARMQEALGPRYDFRAFNDAVVTGGNVPLDVLARVIDRTIAAA